MLKSYLINVCLVFVAIGFVGLFQFMSTSDGVSAGEAFANMSDRAGLLAVVWIGGSFVGGGALMIFHVLAKAQKQAQKKQD